MEFTLDTSFIGKPHESDPRRVYSQTGADWQHRVDFDRLRKDRLQRAIDHRFPVYDDDKYGTVTLQQFAHSIGLTLYEGMWISCAYSLQYPAEIKENMYFAVETFASHPGLSQTCRLEENVLVTAEGPVVFTLMEHTEEA
jgi:Xaa-Pro aminopeptidase